MHNRSFAVRRSSDPTLLKNSHSLDAGEEEKVTKEVENSHISFGLETIQGADVMEAIGFGVELPSFQPEDIAETSQAYSSLARNVDDLFQVIEDFLEHCLV